MSQQGNNYFCKNCGSKHHAPNYIGFKDRHKAEKLRLCKACYLDTLEEDDDIGDMMQL